MTATKNRSTSAVERSTPIFLMWLADRLVNDYGENENGRCVQRLRREAERARKLRSSLCQTERTYELVDLGSSAVTSRRRYRLFSRGTLERAGGVLQLTHQQARDLSDQLDAPIDYFNGPPT